MSDKIDIAIERLKTASKMSLAYYKQPLVVTTSGGKDSSVCVALAQAAGIPFEVIHNHTTADAPETVYFVREEFKRLEGLGIKCTVDYPVYKGEHTSMWKLIDEKGPPNRLSRHCCSILKERGGKGRFIVTGVRWAESAKRATNRGIYETLSSDIKKAIILNNDNDEKRRLFETCSRKAKRACNPIIDWTDTDVWGFLAAEQIPVNPLYQCGFSRVGCIGCPLAKKKARYREFARYPKYKAAYIQAFRANINRRKALGKTVPWENAEDCFRWWMEDGVLPGQMEFSDLDVGEEGKQ